jgi:hypothetical protein
VTDRQSFRLINDRVKANALRAVAAAPQDYVVSIGPRKRSSDQNAKLWAMLGDVARARPEGRQWVPETWKAAFMHYLGHQVQFCDGLDNSGPFPLGFRSSQLSVRQMADLITCVQAYGDQHGVEWTDAGYGDAANAA